VTALVEVADDDVGGQVLAAGLVDQVRMDVVPMVFGSVDAQHLLEDPAVVIANAALLRPRASCVVVKFTMVTSAGVRPADISMSSSSQYAIAVSPLTIAIFLPLSAGTSVPVRTMKPMTPEAWLTTEPMIRRPRNPGRSRQHGHRGRRREVHPTAVDGGRGRQPGTKETVVPTSSPCLAKMPLVLPAANTRASGVTG